MVWERCGAWYVSVVGLWENKAGYYDLNSQGRETCHMTTKETPLYYKIVTQSIIYERKPEIFRLETISPNKSIISMESYMTYMPEVLF